MIVSTIQVWFFRICSLLEVWFLVKIVPTKGKCLYQVHRHKGRIYFYTVNDLVHCNDSIIKSLNAFHVSHF